MQHGKTERAVGRRETKGQHHAQSSSLGGGGPAAIDCAHHNHEDSDWRQKKAQSTQAFNAGRYFGDLLGERRSPKYRQGDDRHEQQGQQNAGQDARCKELPDRGVGQRAVDDQVDRRRDQDAKGCSGCDGAQDKWLVVGPALELVQGDCAYGCGGGNRRT